MLKRPSHSDKDHKDRTAFLKLYKHRENGTKCRKKHNYQVCSTSLLRSCQTVTASNTSQLRFVARLITHSPRPLRFNPFFCFNKTFQIALRTDCALTTFSPRSSRSYKFNSTLSTLSFVLQVFLSELCFQKVAREGIKVRKWEAAQNWPRCLCWCFLYGRGTGKSRAQPTRPRLFSIPTPSYPPQQHIGSLRPKQSLIALIQSTFEENVLILWVHDKS